MTTGLAPRAAVWTIALCFAAYLFASSPSWREPVMGDEVNCIVAAKAFNEPATLEFFKAREGGDMFGIWHPPLYLHAIAFLGKFLGYGEATARLYGAATFLAALILIYGITVAVRPSDPLRRRAAALACALFTVCPLVVRGSLLIDNEATVCLAVALLLWCLVRSGDRISFGGFAALAIAFAISLWAKLSTPVLLAVALTAYHLITGRPRAALFTAAAAAAGAAIFTATWYLYCLREGRDPSILIDVPLSVLRLFSARQSGASGHALIARNIWAVAIWTSPAFLLLAVLAARRQLRSDAGRLLSLGSLGFYGIAALLVYCLIGGVTHSFPKYHYAIAVPFAITVAWYLADTGIFETRKLLAAAALACAGIGYCIAFVGDPLYPVNYALKEDLIMHRGFFAPEILSAHIRQVTLIFLLFALLYVIFLRLRERSPFVRALVVTAVVSNIALLIVQARADYNTVYCYGARGVEEAAAIIRSRTDTSRPIIAPPEIVWRASDTLESYFAGGDLRDRGRFIAAIERSDPACVAYGITGNTVEQYRRIFDTPEVKEFLQKRYLRRDVGSYTLWLKRGR